MRLPCCCAGISVTHLANPALDPLHQPILAAEAEKAEESGEEIFGEEVPDLPETEEEENLPEEETPEDDK